MEIYPRRAAAKGLRGSLREVIMVKYKIRDKDVFSKAYGYVEQYYWVSTDEKRENKVTDPDM